MCNNLPQHFRDIMSFNVFKNQVDSDLHCKLCAPHMRILPKHQEDDKEMQNDS